MLHWFVEENVLKALDGIAIEESNVEVDPNNLCSGVTDENVTLKKIQVFFYRRHMDVCLKQRYL